MVIFLYGKDTYRSKKRLKFLTNRFIKKYGQNNNLNISKLEGQELKPQEINKYLFSRGLFSNKKLIIIHSIFNPYNKKTKKLDKLSKKLLKPIKSIADKDPKDSNIIIIWDRKIKQKNLTKNQKKLFKFLKKLKETKQYRSLSNQKTKKWIKKKINEKNYKITQKAISLLNEIYGNDLHALSNEIKKIVNLDLKDKLINKKTINELVLKTPKQTIWDLTDAVGNKKKSKALGLLSSALENGTPIDYIIAMLGYQYRLLFKIKAYQKNHNEKNYKTIAKTLSVHPYPCKKAIKAGKNYTLSEIKKIYTRLTNIDLVRKKSSIDPEILLDLLIIKN